MIKIASLSPNHMVRKWDVLGKFFRFFPSYWYDNSLRKIYSNRQLGKESQSLDIMKLLFITEVNALSGVVFMFSISSECSNLLIP